MCPYLQQCCGSLLRQQNCLNPRQHSHEDHQIICLAIVSENSGRRNISCQLVLWYNSQFSRLGADCGLHWATSPGWQEARGLNQAFIQLVLVTDCVCPQEGIVLQSVCHGVNISSSYRSAVCFRKGSAFTAILTYI